MGDQLPLWIGVAAAVGIPLLAFAGSVAGQVLGRNDARDLEVRWRREETMRTLRWASELAVVPEVARAEVGLAVLHALSASNLLQAADQDIVAAVLEVVVPRVAYDEDVELEEVD